MIGIGICHQLASNQDKGHWAHAIQTGQGRVPIGQRDTIDSCWSVVSLWSTASLRSMVGDTYSFDNLMTYDSYDNLI